MSEISFPFYRWEAKTQPFAQGHVVCKCGATMWTQADCGGAQLVAELWVESQKWEGGTLTALWSLHFPPITAKGATGEMVSFSQRS